MQFDSNLRFGTTDFNPTMRKRWKRLCAKLLDLRKTLALQICQACGMGIMDKEAYMGYIQDKPKAFAKNDGNESCPKSAAPKYQQQLQQDCHHLEFKRYGNRHGSFAMCLMKCQNRWKWEGTGWKLHGCSSKLSLPLPSFLTTVDGSIPAPASHSDQLCLEALSSKAKARPGRHAKRETLRMSASRRPRPASVTPSVAGHQLQEDELQDFDLEMTEDVLSLYSWSAAESS